MRVLFVARHFTYFRTFESVIATLAARGHDVHLAADREDTLLGGRELADRLATRFPDRVSLGDAPVLQAGRYRRLATALRLGLDFLRYSDPHYTITPKIRERARERTPLAVLALAGLPFRGTVTRALQRLEQAVPGHAGVDDFFRRQQPDLLLITPLIELGSPQLDYIRAARRLAVRSALCVWSWDHLSSKALIRVVPDALIVWNDVQRQEAARFHGIASDRVIVTGAQCFDQWFDRQATRDGDAFRRRVGLPLDRPFILYVCSALFKNSPSEAALVADWIRTLRRSPDPRVRAAAVLVRPHPQRLGEWRGHDRLAGFEHVAFWGANPVDPESRADYFDSMYHAAAIVGLNTSALVEGAIVDRPVFTILLEEFRENQEGTFHFHHLLNVGDGFLNVARSLDEHAAQLAGLLGGGPVRPNRPFVEQFIRPHGVNVPATDVFVTAVEELAARGRPDAEPTPVWVTLLRPVVYVMAVTGEWPWVERLYWSPIRRREWAGAVRAIAEKHVRRRVKRHDRLSRVTRQVGRKAVARVKTAAKQALGAAGMMGRS